MELKVGNIAKYDGLPGDDWGFADGTIVCIQEVNEDECTVEVLECAEGQCLDGDGLVVKTCNLEFLSDSYEEYYAKDIADWKSERLNRTPKDSAIIARDGHYTHGEDEMICPHCNAVFDSDDLDEETGINFGKNYQDDNKELWEDYTAECPVCNKKFAVSHYVVHKYSCRPC